MKRVRLRGASFVYQGLIDDKVAEFPWGHTVDKTYLENILRRGAVFERQMLVNDGYLLLQPAMRPALLGPDQLLRGLMGSGHVALLCRMEELEEMPGILARTVPSYEHLSKDREAFRRLKNKLRRLRVDPSYRWARWPKFDNRHGFELLAEGLVDKKPIEVGLRNVRPSQFERTLLTFFSLREREPQVGARTHWEAAAREYTLGNPKALKALMQLGNEMYHFNMAAFVAASANAHVAVATRLSATFTSRFIGGARAIRSEHVQLPKRLLRLPTAEFVRVMSDADVLQKKTQYLDALEDWVDGESARELDDCTRAYSEAIQSAYREFAVSERTSVACGAGTVAVSAGLAAAGTFLGAPALAVSGIALAGLAVASTVVGGLPTAHLASVWRSRRLQPELVDAMRARRTAPQQPTATIKLEPDSAMKFVRQVNIFRG
jgi:hypothetical protein